MKRLKLKQLVLGIFGIAMGCYSFAQNRKPNIVLILADDFGYSSYRLIVKNLLKSDYPPPEEVALTPIFAAHRKFFHPHMPFGQSPARTLPRPKDVDF
jgi:hypothetical protein